ncbi:MAG: cobalamin-dependent protein, partial [Candidatus Coatesbacteria bacterium]|nr:cobalamin-dependent protein [Candidatus Coatesbacteria bacterium]
MAKSPKVLLMTAKTVRPKYQCMPMIGVAYIAAYLRERDIEVDILDATALDVTYDGVVEYVSYYNFDFVGVTSIAATHQSALRHLKEIKAAHPNIITIIGGPHATAIYEEVIRENDFVDYLVRGEGEITAHELIDTLWKGGDVSQVKGIAYMKDGRMVTTPPRPYIKDLDTLPYPALDLMPLHEYYFEMRGLATKKDLILPFSSGRGCYSNCGFCASKMMWGGPRLRSVDKVIEELVYMRDKYNMKVLFSYDDILSSNRKWLIEFCQKFVEAGLNNIR